MKNKILIICLAYAVISCEGISKKVEEVTQGSESTQEEEAAEIPKTEEQIAQELWMNKIADGEWENVYGHNVHTDNYITFDTPVLENGTITGEFQLKYKPLDYEAIYFYRYTRLSDSKMEVEMYKHLDNGVENQNIAEHKIIYYYKLFDEGKTFLMTDADPDSDTSNKGVSTNIYKINVKS